MKRMIPISFIFLLYAALPTSSLCADEDESRRNNEAVRSSREEIRQKLLEAKSREVKASLLAQLRELRLSREISQPKLQDDHGSEGESGDQQPATKQEVEEFRKIQARLPHRILRRTTIGRVDIFRNPTLNPGKQFVYTPPGTNSNAVGIALAEYLIDAEGKENPWKAIWGRDHEDFQNRIVIHELAHVLHEYNKSRVLQFGV